MKALTIFALVLSVTLASTSLERDMQSLHVGGHVGGSAHASGHASGHVAAHVGGHASGHVAAHVGGHAAAHTAAHATGGAHVAAHVGGHAATHTAAHATGGAHVTAHIGGHASGHAATHTAAHATGGAHVTAHIGGHVGGAAHAATHTTAHIGGHVGGAAHAATHTAAHATGGAHVNIGGHIGGAAHVGGHASGHATGGLHVKIGGAAHTGGKTHIKIHVNAKAKLGDEWLKGSCPMATQMGFKAATKVYEGHLPMCGKMLKATCCELGSMKDRFKAWKADNKVMGNNFWSSSRLPMMASVLMSGMNATVAGCGKVAVKAKGGAKAKGGLHVKIGGSVKGKAKAHTAAHATGGVHVAAHVGGSTHAATHTAAHATGGAHVTAHVGGHAAAHTAAHATGGAHVAAHVGGGAHVSAHVGRRLQAITGHASGHASGHVAAHVGGHASGHVAAHVGGHASGHAAAHTAAHATGGAHVTAHIGGHAAAHTATHTAAHATGGAHVTAHIGGHVGGAAHAATHTTAHIGGHVGGAAHAATHTSGHATGGLHVKIGGAAKGGAHVGGKTHIKINIGGSAKAKAKVTPATYNKGTQCQPGFAEAFNAANLLASSRKAVMTDGRRCFKSLFHLKAQMSCASCDPRNGAKFASKAEVHEADTADVQKYCANYFGQYDSWIVVAHKIADYAQTPGFSADWIKKAKDVSDKLVTMRGHGLDFSPCMVSHAPAAHAKTDDKKRVLQAVVPPKPVAPAMASVTHDDWFYYKHHAAGALTSSANASSACFASSGMQELIKNYVFAENASNFTYFDGLFAAYDVLFDLMATKKTSSMYTKFKGKKIHGSFTKVYKRKLQTVTPPAHAAEGKMTLGSGGVDLTTTYGDNTGLPVSETSFQGDGQAELSGNIMRFAGVVLAFVFAMLM